MKNSVLTFKLAGTDIAFTPLPANRLTAAHGGFDLNRVDMQTVPFSNIALISVFYRQSVTDSQLLLFLQGYKNPFVCDCFKIHFNEFDGVKRETMPHSIRNFIKFVQRQNSGLLLDEETANFVGGNPLPNYRGDITRLTTALTTALLKSEQLPKKTNKLKASPIAPAKSARTLDEVQEKAKFTIQDPVEKIDIQEKRYSQTTPSSSCPKCGVAVPETQLECHACGIVFEKWRQHKAREALLKTQISDADKGLASVSDNHYRVDELEAWLQLGAKTFSLMLIVGFSIPLLKYSVMFGASQWVWPWHIMGFGMDMQKAAAMATFSSADHMLLWAISPLITGLIVLIGRIYFASRGLSLTLLICGTCLLGVLFIVLYKQAEILGLMFTPPTIQAGIMLMLVVMAGAMIAAVNNIRKNYLASKSLRWLSGVAGFLLMSVMALQLIAAGKGWNGWSMVILYSIMIAYGLFAFIIAFKSDPEYVSLQRLSFLVRALLYWAPVACLIAQYQLDDPFIGYVIGGGGGFGNILVSVIKTFLIYYGAALMMAMGFAGFWKFRLGVT